MRDEQRNALAILRDLHGTPLSVLLAMFILKRPMTKKFLSTALRLDYKTISSAVDFLELQGHVTRQSYRAWALPGGQLPLPGFHTSLQPSEPSRIPPATSTSVSSRTTPVLGGQSESGYDCMNPPENCTNEAPERILGPGVREGPRNGKNSRFETGNSPVSPTTTTTDTPQDPEKVVVVGSNPAETGEIPVSAELERAFQSAGIGQNLWPELAGLDWCTPEYVDALAAWVRDHDNRDKRNTGFLIHCIRSHDPLPDPPRADWRRFARDKYTKEKHNAS